MLFGHLNSSLWTRKFTAFGGVLFGHVFNALNKTRIKAYLEFEVNFFVKRFRLEKGALIWAVFLSVSANGEVWNQAPGANI